EAAGYRRWAGRFNLINNAMNVVKLISGAQGTPQEFADAVTGVFWGSVPHIGLFEAIMGEINEDLTFGKMHGSVWDVHMKVEMEIRGNSAAEAASSFKYGPH